MTTKQVHPPALASPCIDLARLLLLDKSQIAHLSGVNSCKAKGGFS